MARMARWCFGHRRAVLAGWLLVVVVLLGVAGVSGSKFNSNFSLPNTDSQAAVDLLTANFTSVSGESDQVVVQALGSTTVTSAAVEARVTAALQRVAEVPGVETVVSPYSKKGASQVSRDAKVAFATVAWDKKTADITTSEAKALIKAAESADGADVHVSLSGPSITNSERPGTGLSVAVGVIAALVVLLIVFGGAVLASLMPLLAAVIALVAGISGIEIISHVYDMSSVSIDLALLIGLGVGVDYGLFIVSRHRSGVKAGLSYQDAAAQAVTTSGRTVLFAGLTVCIALLGQFALGVSFLYGLSISSALAVALTMATCLTLLPAMLGFLGPKVLSRRERRALAAGRTPSDTSRFWSRWSRFIESHPKAVATVSLAAVVVIALPIFGLRLGNSSGANDPSSYTTHQSYVALADGFGPGFNGPLELVARTSSTADTAAFDRLVATVSHAGDVASVTKTAASPNGKVLLATVYPSSGPSAKRTVTLVNDLRHVYIPSAETGTTLQVHVGGVTATNIDFSHVLTEKLPLFIAVVVLLAFVLLMAVFRSLLIPLVASAMNLLSVCAALGALNAVFNWGWGASILGKTTTGPVDAFIPVLMFSVLFGLSMDYEVYLISRVQEEWLRLRRSQDSAAVPARYHNHQAITVGQAHSGRIIAAAAGIMTLVFGSFILGGQRSLEEFGFGLGFSVLVDAFVIRSLLVPAVSHLIGPANWSFPRWLDRIIPNLAVEPAEPEDRTPSGNGDETHPDHRIPAAQS